MSTTSIIETDAVVIGAGPVGLFQVFQLGLLGLKAHVIDVLPEAGGQCVALYPDKPIYDIPGIPVCSGRELAQHLLTQARPFLPLDGETGVCHQLHLNELVSELNADQTDGFLIRTQQGTTFKARAVFVAAGAGAFVPRSLNLPGLDEAANVHYHVDSTASAQWVRQSVLIVGGGEEAVSTALSLAAWPAEHKPATIGLLHRRDQFQIDPDLDAALRQCISKGEIVLHLGMPQDALLSDQRVSALQVLSPDSQVQAISFDHLVVRQGMSPKLGPLTSWGLALERKQVAVSSATFESQTAGIYAVGDINTYPGKKRLLLCGFHEATLAAHAASAALNPDAPQHLLYTTTSPLLHQRLGVQAN